MVAAAGGCLHRQKKDKNKQKILLKCVHKREMSLFTWKLTLLQSAAAAIFLQGLVELWLGNCDDRKRKEKKRKDVNVNWHFIEGNSRLLRFSKLTSK